MKERNLHRYFCTLLIVFSGIHPFSSGKAQTYSQSSGTTTLTGQTYTSLTADLSAVKVTGGILSLSNSTISSSGNSSSTDNSSFYGLNAVILAYTASGTAVINSSGNKVSSTGTGANGLFAYGTASVTSTGDKFTHTGGGGHALMCSGGATMTIVNDTAVTSGGSSSVIATDRGGGVMTVTGGTYTANGNNSAALYSTGTITCTNATLKATGAEPLVVEGANKIILNNCTVIGTYNKWGSLVYQSMSGDAAGTDGYLTMTDGSFTYTGTAGGLFYNTNSTATITLNRVTLKNSGDTLVRCIKGSWGGSSASSGGITYLIGKHQTMSGLIHIDANSKAYITLKDTTSFTGAINKSNTASLVTLTMDCISTWTVASTSYINGLITNPCISGTSVSNIIGNGNNVYYTKSTNTALGGLTYSLVNGGYLLPLGSTTGVNDLTSTENSINLQNYPNPFTDNITVSFNLVKTSDVELSVMDLTGRIVKKINQKDLTSGKNELELNMGCNLPSGLYILKLMVSNGNEKSIYSKKLVKQ